ncbi:MAG TPA: hypothetical protein VLI54_00095 [Bacillota bacterium]|nr:hypothetical protein [Bacillota bacterium]
MPILCGIRAERSPVITPLSIIFPGEVRTVTDMAEQRRSLITTACLPDNSGGIVYRWHDDTHVEQPDGNFYIDPELLSPQNEIGRIGINESFEYPIVTIAHASGILVMQHLTPDSIHTLH